MKIKVINVTPQEGESPEDVIKRIVSMIEGDTKSESEELVNLSEEEDNCTCSVCQLRRQLQASLEGKKEESGPFTNPSVKESFNSLIEEAEEHMAIAEEHESSFLSLQDYNFSQTLESMKNGYRVIRGDWPAVMSIGLVPEGYEGIQPEHFAQFYNELGKSDEPYYLIPYQFTQEDLLATDWKVLKYKV